MREGNLATVCVLALMLSACGGASDPQSGSASGAGTDPAVEATAVADQTAATANAGEAPGEVAVPADALLDEEGNPITLVPFDIDSVPVSAITLGELPFVSMPEGYGPVNSPRQRAFARFPFRLGDGLHWVEGASWNSLIGVARNARRDKEFSPRELRRNLETVFEQAGAKKVFDGPFMRDLYFGPQLRDEIAGSFHEGVNLHSDTPTTVHVIRQADRTIWLQLSTHSHGAALVVVEERPFEATARWSDEFPYLTLPAAYDDNGSGKQRDFDMYPFWTGDAFEEVEGRTFTTAVRGEERGYSMYEVRRNIEAMMAEAGGTRVFEGRIPEEASERYDRDLKGYYSRGTGFSWDDYDSLVYRVNRPDGREVWVHARLEYLNAGWVVAEREGFVQTAALLPASELKKQLDADGRVAIEVNFAVDRAEILPDSQPQIAQVVELLRGDAGLSLAVEGHTDNTGQAARNRSLSEARAAAVVAALTAAGIDATRLQPAGFGDSRPVADNATDDGRARNRRVELVRQ